jgi:hypothetical protein
MFPTPTGSNEPLCTLWNALWRYLKKPHGEEAKPSLAMGRSTYRDGGHALQY